MRQKLVGDLRRVLRPRDLRRVQPAADVDECATLARETSRCSVGEALRMCETLIDLPQLFQSREVGR